MLLSKSLNFSNDEYVEKYHFVAENLLYPLVWLYIWGSFYGNK